MEDGGAKLLALRLWYALSCEPRMNVLKSSWPRVTVEASLRHVGLSSGSYSDSYILR
jgi:hypothetical protein